MIPWQPAHSVSFYSLLSSYSLPCQRLSFIFMCLPYPLGMSSTFSKMIFRSSLPSRTPLSPCLLPLADTPPPLPRSLVWEALYFTSWSSQGFPSCTHQLRLQACVFWGFTSVSVLSCNLQTLLSKGLLHFLDTSSTRLSVSTSLPHQFQPSQQTWPSCIPSHWIFSSQVGWKSLQCFSFTHNHLVCLPSWFSLTYFSYQEKLCVPTAIAFVNHHQFLSGFCNSLLLTSLPPSLSSTKHPSCCLQKDGKEKMRNRILSEGKRKTYSRRWAESLGKVTVS